MSGTKGRLDVDTTHEHGYSQTQTGNAFASMAREGAGLFLSAQTRPSLTAFGRCTKGWMLDS